MKAKALAILTGHLATKPAAAANFGCLLSTHRAPRVMSASNPDRGAVADPGIKWRVGTLKNFFFAQR